MPFLFKIRLKDLSLETAGFRKKLAEVHVRSKSQRPCQSHVSFKCYVYVNKVHPQ